MSQPTSDQPNDTRVQQLPPVDPSNPMLGPVLPAILTCSLASTPNGTMVVHTLRTPAGTHTVIVPREQALDWARNLRAVAEGASPLIVPAGVLR